jgi:hypothetical protein
VALSTRALLQIQLHPLGSTLRMGGLTLSLPSRILMLTAPSQTSDLRKASNMQLPRSPIEGNRLGSTAKVFAYVKAIYLVFSFKYLSQIAPGVIGNLGILGKNEVSFLTCLEYLNLS